MLTDVATLMFKILQLFSHFSHKRTHCIHSFIFKKRLPSHLLGFPGGTSGKEPACHCRKCKRCRFDAWVRKIPWRRAWQPTPVFLPGESYGQRILVGYSSRSHRVGHGWSDLTQMSMNKVIYYVQVTKSLHLKPIESSFPRLSINDHNNNDIFAFITIWLISVVLISTLQDRTVRQLTRIFKKCQVVLHLWFLFSSHKEVSLVT